MQGNDLDPVPVCGAQILQAFIVLRQVAVMRRVRVRLGDGKDGIRRREAHHIVDVPVRVIALDALAEPENGGDTEHAVQLCLQVLLACPGVAVGIQQHRLRGKEEALTVALDGAALQKKGAAEARQGQGIRDALRHGVILVPRGELTAPGIESPVRHLHPAPAALHEDGPVVPAPHVVRLVVEEAETLHPAAAQHGLDTRVERSRGIDTHLRLLCNGRAKGTVALRELG